ncbi:MAG: imidazole glycerol phosphate synthase subunit HisH [Oscillospiraceae bacterium]|nr:imidazole glycerol phosphate synthase subunit HisH [Oscillospiraceae bacterium]
MVGIIDYGVGNLFSLRSSLEAVGAEVFVSGDAAELARADRLVLPGVGAFEDAACKLRQTGMDKVVYAAAEQGKPLLGICLGMQMLFEESHEYGCHKGLGLLKGQVVAMEGMLPPVLKIPHIGWNSLQKQRESRILSEISEGDFVYFVHSFHAVGCEASLAATTQYGIPITAAVEQGNVMGCQFHPEKSGGVGLAILKTFSRM